MTEERLRFIETCCFPSQHSAYRKYFNELLKEVKRARQSERIARAAAQIYKQDIQYLRMRKSA